MTMNWLLRMFQQEQTTQTAFYLPNGAMMGFVSEGVRILEVLGQKYIILWMQHVMATMFSFLRGSSPNNCYKMSLNGDEEVVYGEFIWWIGIWVLMSTVDGADWHSFWSTKNVNAFDGAPCCLTPFYVTQAL